MKPAIPHTTNRYKPRTAYWLMGYAAESHDSEASIRQRHRRKLYSYLAGEFHNVLGAKIADTQGFILVARHKHEPYMIIAFRGSEMTWRMEGWRTNMSTYLDTASWLKHGHERLPVHRGFLHAYGAVRQEIISAVRDIRPLAVYVTGYSLGAALATLAAYHIQKKFPSTHVTMYNFASPFIGDRIFAKAYTATVQDSHRIVHDGDLVPRLRLLREKDRRARAKCVHVGQLHVLPRHPDSRFPHHDREYYIDQLRREAFP